MSNGFKNFEEEDFHECFRNHRGCVPNHSNSDYSERKINLFLNVDYEDIGDVIKTNSAKIKNYFNDVNIEKITTDLDDSDDENGLLFFDIFLKDNISKDEFVKGLNLINENL